MTAEQYVLSVGKLLKCNQARKQQIEKQLLSEIKQRVASGEDAQSVINRMGTPDKVARGYNKDVTEKENKMYQGRQKLRKLTRVLVVLALLAVLVNWLLPKLIKTGSNNTITELTARIEREYTQG